MNYDSDADLMDAAACQHTEPQSEHPLVLDSHTEEGPASAIDTVSAESTLEPESRPDPEFNSDADVTDSAAHQHSASQTEHPLEQDDHAKQVSATTVPAEVITKAESCPDPELYSDELIAFAASFLSEEYDVGFVPKWMQPKRRIRRLQEFSMMEALDDHPDILIMLVGYLDLQTLISLYAIDRRFHFLLNSNYVAYICRSMKTWAPGSDVIFPWRAYRSLCVRDPVGRVKSKWEGREHEAQEMYEERRDVPGLRWLQMVVYREGVCKDILIQLVLKGHYLPFDTSPALKRMWFLLDLPLNAHRIALIRSEDYMPTETLVRLACFFMKLDMHFTRYDGQVYPTGHRNQKFCPEEWAGGTFVGCELREYLLAERNLTPLWRVLHGWSPDPADPQCPMTRLDILRLWVRHKYTIPPLATGPVREMSVMGVPWQQLGMQRFERIYADIPLQDRKLLLRPDELVMLEGIRRKLCLHKAWIMMATWGITDAVGRTLPRVSEEEMNRRLMEMKV